MGSFTLRAGEPSPIPAAVTLDGDSGDDTMKGGDGKIYGGDGRDVLSGGWGNDKMSGGLDADRFVFGSLGGHDTITDFGSGQDLIVI